MDRNWRDVLWRQFGATIDMLGNALEACPEGLWKAHMWSDPQMPVEFSDFWYVAYHTIFWLDLYLSGSVEGFMPPAPYTLDELDSLGILPERVYTRDELQSYLAHCRKKCHETIVQLTDGQAHRMCSFSWSMGGISFEELLLDNMRHVQEHGAQLNLFLGQEIGSPTGWVAQTKSSHSSQ